MQLHLIRAWAVALATLALATPASAAPIFFDNKSDFLAAAAPTQLESFEGLAPETERHTDPIATPNYTMTLSALSAGQLSWRVTDDAFPSAGVFPTDGDNFLEAGAGFSGFGAAFAITFTFSEPVDAFGLHIVDFGDVGGSGNLTITAGPGPEFLIAASPPALGNGNILFAGLIDTMTPFSVLTVAKTTTTDGIGIDETYFRAAADLPEPSAILLIVSGLLGLLVLSVSRRDPGSARR